MTDSDVVSHTAFIYEGFPLPLAILRFAGCDITEKLERGYSFTATAESEIVPDVTEKLCFIGLDHDTEHKTTAPIDNEKTYRAPQTKSSSLSSS